jgi:hypothetical protein
MAPKKVSRVLLRNGGTKSWAVPEELDKGRVAALRLTFLPWEMAPLKPGGMGKQKKSSLASWRKGSKQSDCIIKLIMSSNDSLMDVALTHSPTLSATNLPKSGWTEAELAMASAHLLKIRE